MISSDQQWLTFCNNQLTKSLQPDPARFLRPDGLPPLIVPDTRRPGALMPPISLRLPPAVVADLEGQAARLGCSRAALTRALLAQGVAQLREAMPA